MELDEKIGQMLMVGFRGTVVDDGHVVWRDIGERHLGGVLLFDFDVPLQRAGRNIESPRQVGALAEALQRAADGDLLIAIDQEGGRVSRLKEECGFPPSVSAQYLGEQNDLELTYRHAATTAELLAGLGINLNLAPVVDLNTNPDNPIIGGKERSFSADAGMVAAQAHAVVAAHRERGVRCALKHFPGHGSSADDSHQGLVDVTRTWSRRELEPYERLVDEGLADAVMTAHVFHAELDPQYPATLSEAIISGLLRRNLAFDGVVISDDIMMGAIARHYGFEKALEMAINAGVDIIAIANNLDYVEDICSRAVVLIKEMVGDGRVSETRIDEAQQRIRRLKDGI